MTATPAAPPQAPVDPVEVGDVIAGKYVVTRILGRGGMGLVVAAIHKGLGETRALKLLLRKEGDPPEVSARFAREAKTASSIKNEHVARVHDVGTTADGTPFMEMEHLGGQDLARMLRDRGRLRVDEAADLLLQACEAIAEAHTLGIVHRDLKPGNIFVTEGSDGMPFVKVLDFGISKTTGTGDMALTESAGLLGSPLYMSPEQIASARSVDARSDVWALGVILYEMLAGARPFGGDSVMEICRAIDRGTYPKLSELRDDVPALLDEVVSAALAREANMRLASVEAFGARIAPFGTKAARDSYEKVRRIATRASRAPAQPSDGGGGVPAGASGVPTAATGAGNFTERGVARSEDRPGVRPRPPRRWRWAAGTGVAAAAVAVTAFFARGGHVPWGRATAGATGCAARGVAACEAECAARDPESCFQLAKILDDGKDAPRDVVRASTLYQVGCDGSVARACNNLGALYAAGDGVARSPTKAVDLFERSCNLGFALACANLGTMHFEGKGLPKDVATGAIWFFRACEGGAALGCFNASIAYGEGKGAAKDPKQSFAYAERACKGGMVLGCIRVETARIHGEGVPKDVQGGLERLDALCTHEAEACESLIPIYNMGIGTDVPADPLQVRAYAKKACDLGDEKACHLDRLLLTVDKGRTPDGKNNEMYATKCDAGDLLGCALLGEDLVDGRGVSVDRARGTMLLERACQGKVERACSRLAAAATSSPTASPASSAPSSTASPAPDGRR